MPKRGWFLLWGLLLAAPLCMAAESKPADNPAAVAELDADTEIKPLAGKLDRTETLQENSTDLTVLDTSQVPEDLDCSDPRLKKQVENFIYKNISKTATNSVPQRRARLLLVRHMHDFSEITADDIDDKKEFYASGTLAYLKISRHRQIYKICRSRNNLSRDMKNITVILYPFVGYYHVVVANLVAVPENVDDATFIFNW